MEIEKWLNGQLINGYYTFEEAMKISNETEGYRLPTVEEWDELLEATKFSFKNKTGHFTFDNGTFLELPTMGYHSYNFRTVYNQGSYGYYWSSSVSSDSAYASSANNVTFGSNVLYVTTYLCAYGYSVYLIKEN